MFTVECRKAGGSDPFGDILYTAKDIVAGDERDAVLRYWESALKYNRSIRKSEHIVFLKCGNTLLDIKTGKILHLVGAAPQPVILQPMLPLADKKEPRLL